MVNIKKALDRHNYIAVLLFLIVGFTLTIALSACGTSSKPAVASDPKASSAAVDEKTESAQPTPPPVDDRVKQFGDVATYQDGVSISVSAPTQFTPSNLDSFPLAAGETAVVFKVVLTNNSKEPLEPGAIAEANSGGKPATYIADVGNTQYPNLGMFPTSTVLPGQTLEWYTAFGVVDPSKITLEISPAPFDYDKTVFTNIPF